MSTDQNGSILVESERLATLESEVSHINKDVTSINDRVSELSGISRNTEKCLAELTVIAKQNKEIIPKLEQHKRETDEKLEKMNGRIGANESRIAWIMGGVAIIAAIAPFVVPVITKKLGF